MTRLSKYQLDTDVRKGRRLYGMSGKIIFEGEWIPMKPDKIILVEMTEEIAQREGEFYLKVNDHQNIIRTRGSVENSLNRTIFIQDFAPHHDLASVLMENRLKISHEILKQMFLQIADAMSYVASKGIVHGDLGCRNVLVFQVDTNQPANSLVKITDFGLARWLDRPPVNEDKTIVPIRYCALEILRDNRHESYSEKSDVYSMGVLIWEALSNGDIPYLAVFDDNEVAQMKLNGLTLNQSFECDIKLKKLMKNCWENDPDERPTFEEIKGILSGENMARAPDVVQTTASRRTRTHCVYKLDVDVSIIRSLDRESPSIFEAQWIRKAEGKSAIVLIKREEEPSKHEKLIYSAFKNHRHIVHTYGFVEDKNGEVMILQEQALHGNLQSLLQSGQFQPSAEVLVKIFSQIINAMIDIAQHGLVHGDLCCKNILVFQMHPTDPKRNLVKLTNFISAHPNDPSYTDERRIRVQVRYCALEILRSAGRSNYSEFSDVYSMGVLMWQACSQGKLPYESSVTSGEVRQRKLNNEKLLRPLTCDEQIWTIMTECCLHSQPESRFTFEQIKTQLSKIDFESIKQHQYELNRNVKQNRPLNDINGRFFEADRIPRGDRPITLLVLDGPTAEHEARFYIELKHSHIIHTFGLVKNDQQLLMLLQERAPRGDLQTLLHRGDFEPSAPVFVAIFLQIVEAMIYLTGENIVHGDLRCPNVLVFTMDASEPKNNLVKLTGFSLARRKDKGDVGNILGNSEVQYSAPEILGSEDRPNYSELSDVYSMGMLMWTACSKGKVPYGHRTSNNDIRQQILSDVKLTQPKTCPRELWDAIVGCCHTQSECRWTFAELKTVLGFIKSIRCTNCKKDILENEMDSHQILCSRKRSLDNTRSPDRVYFTRCNFCAVRYLGSELEKHQRSCPSNPSSSTYFRPIFTATCEYCGKEFQDNDILHHQDTCPSRATPPLVHEPFRTVRCNHCHDEYLDRELADHVRSCPRRPRTPIPQVECIHCKRPCLLSDINNHEESCPSKPPRPVPLRNCRYCSRSHPMTKIENHERVCPSRPSPPTRVPSISYPYSDPDRQHPPATTKIHEPPYPRQPKSCMERLYSWFWCCGETD